MRVLLVSGNREESDMRVLALGTACVAAAAENARHEVRSLDLLVEKNPESAVAQAIRDFSPEAIGVSVRNIDDQNMKNPRFLLEQARDAVRWCKQFSQVPVIVGGAGFSILPDAILNYLGADMGIQGEGEAIFPELLTRIQAGPNHDELPGVFYRGRITPARRTYIRDLDTIPFPNPSLLSHSLSGIVEGPVPVQTRRGCPLSCNYCSTPAIEGKSVRWRSPESVVSWMLEWVRAGFRNFYFVDNTFNLPPAYAFNLCSKIIETGMDISWRCILYPAALDRRLIELMAKAGCREASIGFESGSADILYRMHKHYSLEEVRIASKLLRESNIHRMGFLLLGGPGETRETVEESFAFAEALELDALKVSVGIRIYPQTDLSRQSIEEGIIASEQDLLQPCFYVARGLEDWLYETVANQLAKRPNWTT
jgi:radical SAM superfamily enzyme YgiQ (UPF0313 family)